MALAGVLIFSDKIIDKKLANEIRRCLSMTKVGAIIAREMIAMISFIALIRLQLYRWFRKYDNCLFLTYHEPGLLSRYFPFFSILSTYRTCHRQLLTDAWQQN